MLEAISQGIRVRWRARLPGCCEVCGGWTRAGLCAGCRERFCVPVARCARCAIVLPAALPCCTDCLREPPPFERCICVADYGFPWDRLISRFKYGSAPELAGPLAAALQAAADAAGMPPPQAFVALPLSARRTAERGYDQAWELASRLGRRSARPAHARALERQRDATPQARLPRAQRQRNLDGAFSVPAGAIASVRGCHLALVDDVLTTGATARAAATALLAAGAARVDVWVVARTPAPLGEA
ncbi:MAG TPA: ComF family protein [Rubrivivax sp.]|nr:ComF family protein [Burkholderiales bacterium]HNU11824.1 ComF family protein [Rubrivivax sp.]